MDAIILHWISMPLWERGFSLALIILFLVVVAIGIIHTLRGLRSRNIEPSISFTPEGGVKLTAKATPASKDAKNIHKENLSPIEKKLVEVLETQNLRQEKELLILKEEVSNLRMQIQNLQIELSQRTLHEEEYRKTLMPLDQHIMFINLKAVMDRGLDFSVVNDTLGFSLKAYLCKIFIEKCRTPVFYTKLREFLEKLNSLENDQTKLAFLFSFPDVLYQARDEYTKIAKSYDYTIRNVCISGIPHSLVERYKEWNEGHLDIAIQKMKQAIYSSFYKTWQMKIIMCFEILDTVFLFLGSELENTINSLDGEIDEEIERKIKQSGGLSNDRC